MISTESAIQRARRDLLIGAMLRRSLIAAALLFPVARIVFNLSTDTFFVLSALGVIWFFLLIRSVRGSRMAAESPGLIATGQFDAAEASIDGALRAFTIFRAVKLVSLHHLAALRHAQSRWRDAATLCRVVLSQRRTPAPGINRATRLILADSLLEMDDLPGAGLCIAELYQQRLSLGEALSLLLVQLDYESRSGMWSAMMGGAMSKVSLAELMPTTKAARTQALLALAAKKTGREDWESWLRRRVELLVDPQELVAKKPILRELWLP